MDERTPMLLRPIADNAAQVAALQQLFFKHFTLPPVDPLATNEQLGEIYRANLTGQQKVSDAFRELAAYRTPTTVEPIIKHR